MKKASHESCVGKKFGRLTIVCLRPELKRAPFYKEFCDVVCDCGHKKTLLLESILRGATSSCGCYAKERASETNTKHGDTKIRPRLYRIWENMRGRCNNPGNTSYKYYGAKRIKVCNEWDNYEVFRNWALTHGYKDNLTIDRINTYGNYCPENCRWVSRKEQDRNKTTNHLLTFGNKTQCITDWCEALHINVNTVNKRLRLGWSVEQALLTPVRINKTKGEKNG